MNEGHINAAGLALVKQWKGLKTRAYRDVGGIWTISYGHTSAAVTPTMVISEAKVEGVLLFDLAMFEERVSRFVKVLLTDNQFPALLSLISTPASSAKRRS